MPLSVLCAHVTVDLIDYLGKTPMCRIQFHVQCLWFFLPQSFMHH